MDNKDLPVGNIGDVESAHIIRITNPKGKTLDMNFKGDKLIVSGDLKPNEAARIFFDNLDAYFQKRLLEEREKGRKDVS